MRRFLLVLAIGLLAVSRGDAQTAKIQKEVDKKLQDLRTLDQLIAEGLKNNPDIRVAESKVREADAELNRTRMKVASDITQLHAEIQAAQALVDYSAKKQGRMLELYKAGSIEERVYQEAVLALEKAKADLAAKQAKLPYLLGRSGSIKALADDIDNLILRKWMAEAQKPSLSDEEFLRRAMLDAVGRLPTPAEIQEFMKLPQKDRREKWLDQIRSGEELARIHKAAGAGFDASCVRCHKNPWGAKTAEADLQRMWVEKVWQIYLQGPESPLSEKLRPALDARMSVDFNGVPLSEVLENLRQKVGVNLHMRGKLRRDGPVKVKLEAAVPVGAVLQYLEDEHDVVFILRDYGIVVVPADERLPPGAVRVVDFWKHGKAVEKAPAEKEKTKPPPEKTKSAPPGVRGRIERVNPNDELLVELSIGAEAGLAINQVLDVYRLQPEPLYAGRVQVVEVMPARAVARRIGLTPSLKVGDQVTALRGSPVQK
jgi:hypothetical protein